MIFGSKVIATFAVSTPEDVSLIPHAGINQSILTIETPILNYERGNTAEKL